MYAIMWFIASSLVKVHYMCLCMYVCMYVCDLWPVISSVFDTL